MAFNDARNLHFVLFEHIGDARRHQHGRIEIAAVGKRLDRRAIEIIFSHVDGRDLAILEELLELAERYGLHFVVPDPPTLEQGDGYERDERVADIEFDLLVHCLLRTRTIGLKSATRGSFVSR